MIAPEVASLIVFNSDGDGAAPVIVIVPDNAFVPNPSNAAANSVAVPVKA